MNAQTHPQEALAYYDALAPVERRTVDAHLTHCGECQATLADYRRQDALLGALPRIRARRRGWRPAQTPLAPGWLNWLGNSLAIGGLGALAWAAVLQIRHAANVAAAETAGVPADLVVEPGLSLPPAIVRPPSPWLPALPWISLALLGVGLLFVVSRRQRWPAVTGAVLALVLLTGYVPPLSSLPNPAGLAWRLVGGYHYDPNLPFRNAFLIAGRPEQILAPYLDGLIGAVGLSPLDPELPLAGYEFLQVGLHPQHSDVALVTTRFIYADGSSRVYPVPLADPVPVIDPVIYLGGFWRSGWRNDGLQRLRSQHLALPRQPFATDTSPIQLGNAQYLDSLAPAAQRLDEVNPYHWLWQSVRVQRLVWAPDGQVFLARMEDEAGHSVLWSVRLDGAAPERIAAGQVEEYGWSPDGAYVVFTQLDVSAADVNYARPYAISAVAVRGQPQAPVQLVTGLASADLPGLTAEGAWFFSDGTAWIVPYGGGNAQPAVTDLGDYRPQGAPRPSPDKTQLAFACGGDVCFVADLLGVLGGPAGSVKKGEMNYAAELAWSPDGTRLAVIVRDPNGLRPVDLVIVKSNGAVDLEVEVAPRDVTDTPQWTPDGQGIFVQTYPQDGRRILAVDVGSGEVIDLSREHWDTYFSLAPDGKSLLLNNGRGGFWSVEVLRSAR